MDRGPVKGTLVVAILALVVAASSLTWQIVTFLLSAGRVRVTLTGGVGALGRGKVTGPVEDGKGLPMQGRQPMGFDMPLVGVQVRNLGRAAVYVQNWGVITDQTWGYSLPGFGLNVGHETPHKLEAGEQAEWVLPAEDVQRMVDALERGPQRFRAYADLGTGRRKHSKNSLRVAPHPRMDGPVPPSQQ